MQTRFTTAVVTGASSGIGKEFAKLLVPHVKRLVLVARNEAELIRLSEELRVQGMEVPYLLVDLAKPSGCQALWATLQECQWLPDLLINNAGAGLFGEVLETSLEREQELIQLNISSLYYLSKMAVQHMVRQGHGTVLNVASVAAFQPGPRMAVYFATKAFVLSFSEAIDQELVGTNVRILTLCPGNTRTAFHATAGTQRVKVMHQAFSKDAQSVAKAGFHQIFQGQRTLVPGLQNKFLLILVRFLPRRLVAWVSDRVLRNA